MINRCLACCFFVCVCFNSFGQKNISIEGQITDSLKNSLKSVSITIRKGDNNVIAFSNSDEKGFYKIDFTTEKDSKFQLVASSIGYETLKFDIDVEQSNSVKNIVLNPKDFLLNEVIVSEKIAIKEANDTTSYRADAFRDKNDKVIEDLLKKIPGFEISKSGTISVYGKAIDKILLEGDDLMNKNYKIISRNLSADLIEKVQVIDKYVEDPLMKGIVSSNRQVLNLTFKADRKSTLFGDISLGIGTSERFDERINLISFLKKAKIYALGSFNTTGKNPMGDLTENEMMNTNDDLFERNQKKEFVNINEISLPNFQSQQVNFNKATLFAPTFIVKPSSKLILKGGGAFYADRNKLQENSSFSYLTAPPIDILETKSIIKKPTDYKGNIEAVFLPNAQSRIRFLSNWNNGFTSNSGSVMNSNLKSNQLLDNTKKIFENRLFYTQRIKSDAVFNVEMFYLNNNLIQNYEVQSSQKRFLSFIGDSTANLTQYLKNPYKSSGIVSQYLLKMGKSKLAFQAGVNSTEEELATNLKLNKSIIIGENKNILKQTDFALNAKYEREIANFRINLELPLHYLDYNLSNSLSKRVFYVTPKIDLLLKKNSNGYRFLYSYNSKLPQISDLSRFYILSNYRNFQQGTNEFLQKNGHFVLLNYWYKNLFDQLFFDVNVSYSKSLNLYNSDLQINKDFNINTLYASNLGNDFYNFSVGITKFLSPIKSSIKLKSNIGLFQFQNQLNTSDTRNIKALSSKFEIGIRSTWKKGFNYHLGAEFDSNTQTISKGNNFNNKTISSFAGFILTFSSKVNAQIDIEQYSFPNSATATTCFFSSGINYEVKSNSLTLSLLAKNLTNNTSFSYNYINDYQKSYRSYNILSRYLIVSANFRF
ncbi:carboxypeptidase-like regulatory domain-containing protein [Emticicia sp.]|uniref:carboxypeptidase-like regulatory domain-containing protein n=1 Tax=Emticicia sp. TaxID=1930953 RepID=UPI0037531145